MRILKYILLLLILIVTATCVFVYTQNGSFSVSKTKSIALQKNVIFNYINDYSNWSDFLILNAKNSEKTTKHSDITIGEAAFATWNAITFKTQKSIENDPIQQTLNWNDSALNSNWNFSTENQNTNVTWVIKGTLNFKERFFKLLGLGINKTIENDMAKSLDNLNTFLIKEVNTFEVTVNGIVQIPEMSYLQQKKSVVKSDFYSTITTYLSKNALFFKDYNLFMNGSPMCFFESLPSDKNEMPIKMCYPISEEIFTSPESEITFGKSQSYQAVKATLKGDYIHVDAAWKALIAYCKKNNIEIPNQNFHLEIYVKNYLQSNKPSEWVTELYLPLKASNSIPPPPPIANSTAETE